jgi:hypothetical protein
MRSVHQADGGSRGFYSSELAPLGALLLIIAGVLLPGLLKARAKLLAAGGTGGMAQVAVGIGIGAAGLAMLDGGRHSAPTL